MLITHAVIDSYYAGVREQIIFTLINVTKRTGQNHYSEKESTRVLYLKFTWKT